MNNIRICFFFILVLALVVPFCVYSKNGQDKTRKNPQDEILKNNQDSADAPVRLSSFIPNEKKYEIMRRLTGLDASNRPYLPYSFASDGFMIHYSTEGENAVPTADKNQNGVPDYVDSVAFYFEYAKKVFNEQIGYKLPLVDDTIGGGKDLFDVYLMDIGKEGYYGYAVLEDKVVSAEGGEMYRAFTVIDNDFSPTDSSYFNSKKRPTYLETGINAVRFTAAHEYHHAVQFAYSLSVSLLHELTSTWMEYRVIPKAYDFLQFHSHFLKYPSHYNFGDGSDAINGYPLSIFAEYAYVQYGDKFLLRTWQLIGKGINGYVAMDSAFKELGSNGLVREWREFSRWLYYTGKRSVEGKYLIHSKELPEMTFYNELVFTPPSIIQNGILQSFELRALRMLMPGKIFSDTEDTLDVIISNSDIDAAIKNYQQSSDYLIAVLNDNISNSEKIDGIDYYLKTEADPNKIHFELFIHPGSPTNCIDYAFPNPFNIKEQNELFLPVPCRVGFGQELIVSIFNTEMNSVYSSEKHRVEEVAGQRVVRCTDLPKNLSQGIYIYKVTYKNEEKVGKFVIK